MWSSRALILFLLMGWTSYATLAQGTRTKYPFSSIGIGELQYPLTTAHQGMGGLSLSYGNQFMLNNGNPALLVYNFNTTYSAAVMGESRTVNNGEVEGTSGGMRLAYLGLALPIKPLKWTSAIGIAPFSSVGFSETSTRNINNSPFTVEETRNGSGGFTEFYWMNGYAVNRNFFVGAKVSYIFSSIINDISSQIQDSAVFSNYQRVLHQRTAASDVKFSLGAVYTDSVFKDLKFNAGVMVDFQNNMSVRRFEANEIRTLNNLLVGGDTINNNTKGTILLPGRIGGGVSFQRINKWMLGIDGYYSMWDNFRDFEGRNLGMSDGYTIIIGGEIIPDITAASIIKATTYRAGVTLQRLPFLVNDEHVKDFGINFGLSLPVKGRSNVDASFQYGWRGSLEGNQITENYFRFYFGMTINDRWFVQRKFD